MNAASMERPHKRQRFEDAIEEPETATAQLEGPYSLSRPISPPRKRNRGGQRIKSPFQLTRIQDLPEVANHETVTLKDILGDPLISECWEFNFLHDVHFLMSHFDEDTKNLVKVHVVHGFWKREDANRLALQVCPRQLLSTKYAEGLSLYRKMRLRTRTLSYIAPSCRRCSAPIIPK